MTDTTIKAQTPLTRKRVFEQSWPIMLANAAAPIVGLVDTFVIGRFASTTALAGIGLGVVIYGIFYWGFGFLRMSTAGLVAQAEGAEDELAVQGHLARAVPLGMVIGLCVFIAQSLLLGLAFQIYTASNTIESAAGTYIQARLWGLPATLGSIALMGWFVGVGQTRLALWMQIVLNIVNMALSVLFVVQLSWGLWGVGIASAIAEWVGFAAGLALALRNIKARGGARWGELNWAYLLDAQSLAKLGVTNGNIFIRTLCLTFGFNFFGNAAATQGEVFLAANHIHMQFITMSALILDAFAHTAEAVTGAAYGARSHARFKRAVRLTTEFSALFGLLCGAVIYFGGMPIVRFMTDDPEVIATARTYLPWCALAPIIGFPAWQYDGIFIGTTRTREMRDAGIMAVLIYVALHVMVEPIWTAHGLWIAFLGYYIARALTLATYYPRITRVMQS